MRNDIDKFSENQIFLMKDSSYILITGVDPYSTIKNTDKSRMVYAKTGKIHHKGDNVFKKDTIFVLEDESEKVAIAFDTASNVTYSIGALKKLIAYFVGTINTNGQKLLARASENFLNSL